MEIKDDKCDGGKFESKHIPWNKGKRRVFDLAKIHNRHWNGEVSIIDLAKELDVSDRLLRLRLKEAGYRVRQKHCLTKKTKNKIRKTMKRKGIRPKEIYSGVPWNKGKKTGQKVWNKGLVGVQESNKKGKNYEELYGKERSNKYKQQIKERRKHQIFPVKDTTIEVKLQEFLKQLKIEFVTHQYMNIKSGYQCDFMIPKQEGIAKKTIIEAFGNYWHRYPLSREVDIQRCTELREKGWRVLVFWENEIRVMEVNDLDRVIKR